MTPTPSIANMKGLMLLLPLLHLAAGQSTVTAAPSVDSGVVATATAVPSVMSGGSVTTITGNLDGTTYTQTGVTTLVTVMSGDISVFSFDDFGTHAPATTTVDFSIITANRTIVTLTPAGSVVPPADTTAYASAGIANVTNAIGTSTTGTRSGTATSTQTGPASYTNAAPAADVKFGLGFLGFAGALAAVGL